MSAGIVGRATLGGALVLLAQGVLAANWQTTASSSVSVTISDNINLSESDQETDVVVSSTPRLSIQGTGRRLQLRANYAPRFITYLGNSDRSRIDHSLNLNANAELWRRHLFADFRVRVAQRLIDPRDARGSDSLDIGGNRTDTVSVDFAPNWRSKLGRFADLRAQVRFSWVGFDQGGVSDSLTTDARVNLDGGRQFRRLRWGLLARYRSVNNSSTRNDQRTQFRASGTYRYSRGWRFRASLGHEDNAAGNSTLSGSGITWSASVIWNPHRRVNAEFGWRSRPFGDSFFLDARWQRRRAQLVARYTESLTRVQVTELEFLSAQDLGLTDQSDLLFAVPRLTDEVFVRRNFDLGLRLSQRRHSWDARLIIDQRAAGAGVQDDTLISATGRWGYTMSHSSRLNVSLTARSSDFGDADRQDRTVFASASYSDQIWRGLTATLRFSHRRNDSDLSTAEYTENRLTLSVGGTLF